jgi:hypothetical protein
MFVRAGCPGTELIKVVQKSCNSAAMNGLSDVLEELIRLPLLDDGYPNGSFTDVQFIPHAGMPEFDRLAE